MQFEAIKKYRRAKYVKVSNFLHFFKTLTDRFLKPHISPQKVSVFQNRLRKNMASKEPRGSMRQILFVR